MTTEKLRIGLFGYGCVGQGLHDVLNSSKGFKADIVRICVKDRTKKRRIPMSNFTFDKNDILNDDSINLIVELIDDADEAFRIVTTACRKGKMCDCQQNDGCKAFQGTGGDAGKI